MLAQLLRSSYVRQVEAQVCDRRRSREVGERQGQGRAAEQGPNSVAGGVVAGSGGDAAVVGAAGGLGGRVGGGSGLPREKTVTGAGLGPQDFEVPILVTPASEMVTTFVGDDMALALELAKAAAAAEAARVRAGRGPKQLAEAPTAE